MKLFYNCLALLISVLCAVSYASFGYAETGGVKNADAMTHETSKKMINEIVAKDGAKLRINIEDFENSIFQMYGEGFQPNESLNFISNSSDEIIYVSIKADKNGKIHPMGILPAVKGQTGGVCHIDILREKDSIHLKFPWGVTPPKRKL